MLKKLLQEVANIKKLQQAGELETVGYMVITKLRTELAAQNYHYRVKVYNKYFQKFSFKIFKPYILQAI